MVVYPRWRGEHMTTHDRWRLTYGLSPLARGTHHIYEIRYLLNRFIPAGAGNSCELFKWASSDAVYPRWRGELITKSTTMMINFGLSPLARGTPRVLRWSSVKWRFIPAGAGNSQAAHLTVTPVTGLSPLARGTPVLLFCAVVTNRFIPAGAGNSLRIVDEWS